MIPPFLLPADEIRILTPSGAVNPDYIDGAKKVLETWGLKPTEGRFARSAYGRFAGTEQERIADLQDALDDPSVKAILCSRGGYGVAQIVDKLNFSRFSKSPKWLIGFSDITILHNVISNLGVASVHGIMAKHLSELPADSEPVTRLRDILFGTFPAYSVDADMLNRPGKTSGKLIGGNLSVLMALRGSSFDLDYKNKILFIEDIGEKPYHVDRMMQNLRFSGALSQIAALVVGQFSDYDEDPLMMKTLKEIILNAVADYNYPVCFNFPAGHVDYNLALVLAVNVTLQVDQNETRLKF